jgi:uncharacterized protein YceK
MEQMLNGHLLTHAVYGAVSGVGTLFEDTVPKKNMPSTPVNTMMDGPLGGTRVMVACATVVTLVGPSYRKPP